MVSINSLKLIDALFSGCTPEQRSKLISLYRTAFGNSESYKKIRYILETCEFYGPVGEDLKLQINRVVEERFNDAESFSSMLTVLEHIAKKAEDEVALTEEYINSSRLDIRKLSVVERAFAKHTVDLYTALINYFCCMCATLYGKDIFKEINIDLHIGTLDVVRTVTDAICTLSNEIIIRKKPTVWKITRQHFAGINMLEYDGFVLSYVTDKPEERLAACSKIAPYLYEDRYNKNVLCYGVGNITNLDFGNGTAVFGSEIIEKPAMNCFDGYDINYDSFSLVNIMNMLFQSKVCIITPEIMVERLNRYFMIKKAQKNKEEGKCIYCGGTDCEHFVLPLNFDEAIGNI